MTNNQSEQFSNELDTIDSSQVVSSNANEVYPFPETNDNNIQKDDDNISELSDESMSIITESDLKSLERKFCLEIEELEQIIKAQNENHKDMETQHQNKTKQQETFNTELEFVRAEIKKLRDECADLRGQLKQAQMQINSIDNQLKPSPPTSTVCLLDFGRVLLQ